jgi:hypothetical protein
MSAETLQSQRDTNASRGDGRASGAGRGACTPPPFSPLLRELVRAQAPAQLLREEGYTDLEVACAKALIAGTDPHEGGSGSSSEHRVSVDEAEASGTAGPDG